MRRKEYFSFSDLFVFFDCGRVFLCLSLFCAKLLMTHDIYQNIERRKTFSRGIEDNKKTIFIFSTVIKIFKSRLESSSFELNFKNRINVYD